MSKEVMAQVIRDGWVVGKGRTWHRVQDGQVLCGITLGYARMHELGSGDGLPKCDECVSRLGSRGRESSLVTVKYSGKCSMYIEGLDMNCPLCGKLVRSGEQHSCELKK